MPEFYTIKSNARRAARKAGVDPETVYCVPEGWRFPEPNPNILARVLAPDPTLVLRPDGLIEEIPAVSAVMEQIAAKLAPVVTEPERDETMFLGLLGPAPALGGTPSANAELSAKTAKRAASKRKPAKAAKAPAKRRTGKRDGVCDRVIAAIHARWTSIDDLMKLSGWQRHTLRGYISTRAGKDGFTVERKKIDDVSHYRVAA